MTGLVGWWPLHEKSGSTARDLSGNGNHGTVSGPVQGVWGRGGLTSYRQSLDSDYVRIPSTDLGGFDNMTFSFWFRWDGIFESHLFRIRPTQAQLFDFQSRPDSANTLVCNLDDSNGTGHTVESEIQNLENLEADKWAHGAVTYERNGMMKVYIDGEVVGTKDVDDYPVTDFSNDAYTKNNGYNQAFRGYIQGIRVYNRALSPQEIQSLYEWGSGDFTRSSYHDGTDKGAVSRWKFDGNLKDSWNSYDGSNDGASFSDNRIRGSKSANFNGSSFVNVDSISFSDQNSHTFSTWIRPDNQSSYSGILATDMGSSSDNYGLNLRRDSGGRYEFIVSQDTTGVEGPYTLTENSGWYHLVGIYDSPNKRAKLYSNGRKVQDKDVSNASFSTSDGVNIGRYSVDSSTHYYFNGLIDDVRIYNRALLPSEVFQLYQWGTRGRDMRKLTVNSRGDT